MSEYLPIVGFAVVVLHEVGKSGTHVFYRSEEFPKMHKPLVRGLVLTNPYHILSGLQWLSVIALCFLVFKDQWLWYGAAVVSWGVVWKGMKMLGGKDWDSWIVQLCNFIRRK